ncbi:hypothetical protein [Listeria fleischmannii]|uniref:hypothetical protein n=1 Tax=Listeria fleischmannii TaxID=1069827 RepID=UPI00131F1ECC|nr:hypothetical protein [Listeria fleischmannii]
MKKKMILSIVFIALACFLVACGQSEDDSKTQSAENKKPLKNVGWLESSWCISRTSKRI